MNNAVILCAHGQLASGIESGLKLIVGPMENLRLVNFQEGDTFETVDQALTEAFESLAEAKNILFITDLMGGTPFNRSVLLYGNRDNVRVLSGLNFALAYQGLISEEEDIERYVEEVLAAGRDSIGQYAKPSESAQEESAEDGI